MLDYDNFFEKKFSQKIIFTKKKFKKKNFQKKNFTKKKFSPKKNFKKISSYWFDKIYSTSKFYKQMLD